MESEADRDRRRRDRKSLRKTNGSAAAAADDDEAALAYGSVIGSWRVGSKIGEGTFSRIYAATPVDPAAAINGPVVLKVNKSSPEDPATAAAATAATAAAGSATPSTPAPKSDASFAHEAQVFRAVCEAEEKSAGHQARGAKLPLSVPRMYEHNAHAFAQLPAPNGSAQWIPSPDAVEYMVLEQCGVDLSKLRYDWQSRGQQPAAAVQLIDLCLKALERFHKVGFVHRDIKPSNFLTCANAADAAHRVMITDFGLSRRTGGAAAAATAASSAAAAAAPATPPSATIDADNRFVGKSLYASFAAHRQEVQTPRDDVISLLFVMLDLMYGDLPWKELSKERADISKQRRWEDVLASKQKLLGPAVCEQAAQALAHPGDANFPLPDASWLREYSLPPLIRRIFFQLHSMPAGAPVDYASLHVQLSQLQMDVQQQMSGRPCATLVEILTQYAKTAEKEAEQAAKRAQDEVDERARLAEQQRELAKQEEENRRKEIELVNYRARNEARKAEAKANAAAAQQQAEEAAALKAQEEARFKAFAAAEQLRLQRERESLAKDAHRKKQVEGAASDAKTLRPTPFHTWSKRLRDLFADVLHLPRSNLNGLNESTWEPSAEPPTPAPSSVCSLESLWKQADWAAATAVAQQQLSLPGVKFAVWGGDWYRLTRLPESKINANNLSASTGAKSLDRSLALESLSWEQLQGLKAYCDASTTLPRLDRSRMQDESYWKEKDPLRTIAVTVASLYDLAQQAIKGQIKISGFVPVVDKPKAMPTAAGTTLTGAASSTTLKKIHTKKVDAETEAARAAAKAEAGRESRSPSPSAEDTLKALKLKQQSLKMKQEIKSESKVKSEGKIPEPKKLQQPLRRSIALDDSDSSSDDSDDGSGDDLLVPASKSAAAPKPLTKKPAAAAGTLSESDAKAAKRAAKEERRLKKEAKKAAKREKKEAIKKEEKTKKRLSRGKDEDEDISAEDDEAEEAAAAARGDSDEDDAGSGDEVGHLVTKSKRQIEISEKQALEKQEQLTTVIAKLTAGLAGLVVPRTDFALPADFRKPANKSQPGDIVPTYPNDPFVNLSLEFENINLDESEQAPSPAAKKSRLSKPKSKKSKAKDEEEEQDEEEEEEDDASSMAASSVAVSVAKAPKTGKKAAAKEAAPAAGPPRWTRRSARHTTLPADTLDVVIVLDPRKVRSHPDPMADSAPVKHDEVQENAAADAASTVSAAATPTKKTAATAAVAAGAPSPADAAAPLSVSTTESPAAAAASTPAAAAVPSIVVPSTPTAAAAAAAAPASSPIATPKSKGRPRKGAAAAAAKTADEAAAAPSAMTESEAKPAAVANTEAASAEATETATAPAAATDATAAAAAAAPPSPVAITGRKRKGSTSSSAEPAAAAATDAATSVEAAPDTPSNKKGGKKQKTKGAKKKDEESFQV